MKSQSALEFMAIVGVGLILLTIASVVGVNYVSNYFDDITIINAKQTVNNIAAASSLVYAQGIGAKTKVSIAIPEGLVKNFTYASGEEINLRFNQNGKNVDVFKDIGVPISGTLPLLEGKKIIYVQLGKCLTADIFDTDAFTEARMYVDDPTNYSYIGVETYTCTDTTCALSNNFSDTDNIYFSIIVTDLEDENQMPDVDVSVYFQDESKLDTNLYMFDGTLLDETFTISYWEYQEQPYYSEPITTPGFYLISVKIPEINSVGTKLIYVR